MLYNKCNIIHYYNVRMINMLTSNNINCNYIIILYIYIYRKRERERGVLLVVKNLPAKAGDTQEVGLIPG